MISMSRRVLFQVLTFLFLNYVINNPAGQIEDYGEKAAPTNIALKYMGHNSRLRRLLTASNGFSAFIICNYNACIV